jgi:hypothetical protein
VTDCLWFFLPLSERGCSYLCARAPVGADKRLARDVVAMAAGEPAAPQAANEELTEFVDALKKEVRTGSRGDLPWRVAFSPVCARSFISI